MKKIREIDKKELEALLGNIGHRGPYYDNVLKMHQDTKSAPVYTFNTHTPSGKPEDVFVDTNELFYATGMYLRVQKFAKITGENNQTIRVPISQPMTWADPKVFTGTKTATVGNQSVAFAESYCIERLMKDSLLAIGKGDNLVFERLNTDVFYAPALNHGNGQLFDGKNDGFYRFVKPFAFSGRNNREITLTAPELFMNAVMGDTDTKGEAVAAINVIQLCMTGFRVPNAAEKFEIYRNKIKNE